MHGRIDDGGSMDPVVLLGTRSRGLTLFQTERDGAGTVGHILVEVTHDGLSASTWVYAHPDFACLVTFLSDLETSWRGWEGTKEWISLEGELAVSADHLGGRVQVRIDLRRESWTASAEILVGAGEDLTNAARTAEAWLG